MIQTELFIFNNLFIVSINFSSSKFCSNSSSYDTLLGKDFLLLLVLLENDAILPNEYYLINFLGSELCNISRDKSRFYGSVRIIIRNTSYYSSEMCSFEYLIFLRLLALRLFDNTVSMLSPWKYVFLVALI